MNTKKNELTALYEIYGHLSYLEGLISRNNNRKNIMNNELANSNEKIKLDQAKKRLDKLGTVLQPFFQVVVGIICALVIFSIPLLSFNAIGETMSSENNEEISLVFFNGYSALYLILWLIFGKASDFDILSDFFEEDSFERAFIPMVIIGYLTGAYIVCFVVNGGSFWGYVLGLIWPIVQALAFMFHIPMLIFGVELIPNIWSVLLVVLMLVAIAVFFFFVWHKWIFNLVGDFALNLLESKHKILTKERDSCLEMYRKKERELQGQYVRSMELPKYSIGDVIKQYNSYLPASDFKAATVSRIIWCIENRYAANIIGAKQWLAMQANNERMQNMLNNIQISQQRTYEMAQNTYKMAQSTYEMSHKAATTAAYAAKTADEAKRAAEAPVDVDVTVRIE